MGIRDAYKLHAEAEHAVDQQVHAGYRHGRARLARVQPQDDEEHHPFQQHFIEHGRMARQIVDKGKHHAPRQLGRLAPQFAIDEIAESPGTQAERHERRHVVRHAEEGPVGMPGVQPHGHEHAEHAAVIGHAALPDTEDHQRIIEEGAEVVEQHVTDAPAEHDTECDIEQQVGHLRFFPFGTGPARADHAQPPATDKADQVHQPVPVHLQRADGKGNGIDVRIDQHDWNLSPDTQRS